MSDEVYADALELAKIYESGYSDLEFDENNNVIEPDDPYALIKIE